MTEVAVDERSRTIQAVGIPDAGETQVVSITTTSANSNALTSDNNAGDVYRVLATVNAHIATSAPATNQDLPIIANREEYFRIRDGQRISCRTATGTGSLFITKMP